MPRTATRIRDSRRLPCTSGCGPRACNGCSWAGWPRTTAYSRQYGTPRRWATRSGCSWTRSRPWTFTPATDNAPKTRWAASAPSRSVTNSSPDDARIERVADGPLSTLHALRVLASGDGADRGVRVLRSQAAVQPQIPGRRGARTVGRVPATPAVLTRRPRVGRGQRSLRSGVCGLFARVPVHRGGA